MKDIEKLVLKLKNRKETIATMESCTGGLMAHEITNIAGSSEVLQCSLITYSNEFKIKFGVDPNIIATYTVYSIETAKQMAKKVSDFTNATWGIGITGKLGDQDPNNSVGLNNDVYYAIYHKCSNCFKTGTVRVDDGCNRNDKKQMIVKQIVQNLMQIIP